MFYVCVAENVDANFNREHRCNKVVKKKVQ